MGWRSSIARRWRGTVSPTRARAADGRHTSCSGGFVSRDQLGGLACSARQAGREGSAGKLEAASTRRRDGVRALVGWDLAVTPGVVGVPNTVRGGRYLKYRPPPGYVSSVRSDIDGTDLASVRSRLPRQAFRLPGEQGPPAFRLA